MEEANYILITEDGETYQSNGIPEGALERCDRGICDLLDISGDNPSKYFEGEWHALCDVEDL